MRWIAIAVLSTCCTLVYGQQRVATVSGEPENLGVLKKQLLQYHECTDANCYLPQLERQSDLAIKLLDEAVSTRKPGEKLAMVLDIDETSLSTWAVQAHDDLGYIAADFNWCITLHCGKAIAGTLRLFKEAEKNSVAVFFITGRPEQQRSDTEANLKSEGYDHWEHLYLRPENHPKDQSVVEYKSGERGDIISKGYKLVLNVGDQMSDLNGEPQAEHSVKLPNPFYYIP